ncbi:Os02g0167600, partial [Oryza sativa Japonica Group]
YRPQTATKLTPLPPQTTHLSLHPPPRRRRGRRIPLLLRLLARRRRDPRRRPLLGRGAFYALLPLEACGHTILPFYPWVGLECTYRDCELLVI